MSEGSSKSTDISDLQASFSEQQRKISILKDLVRKSEPSGNKAAASAAQEKVKNIAQKLSLLKKKSKNKRTDDENLVKPATSEDIPQNINETSDSIVETTTTTKTSTNLDLTSVNVSVEATNPQNPPEELSPPIDPVSRSTSQSSLNQSIGNDKILMLKQQMEQHKVQLARRASSKQHLEQLVGRLKEQLDTTQQNLDSAAEMGRSMSDLSVLNVASPREHFKSTNDLVVGQQPFNLEKERIKFLENRCRLLEKQLEKEKKANSSHSQAVDVDKDKLEAVLRERVKDLELQLNDFETKEKLWREENERLKLDISKLDSPSGENKSITFDLQEENQRLANENKEYLKRLNDLEQNKIVLDNEISDRGERNFELELKIQELQQKYDEMQQEMLAAEENLKQTQAQVAEAIESNETVNKTAKTEEHVTAEMAKQIQQMQNEISELSLSNQKLKEDLEESNRIEVSEESISQKISQMEATIKELEEKLKVQEETIKNQEEEIMEKSIELNVLNANFKVLEEKLAETSKRTIIFSSDTEKGNRAVQLEEEIQQLKQKLDETNKMNIKLKLKCKKAEKEIENAATLMKEKEELQQKVLVLEEEKGQWQLSQVDDSSNNDSNKLEALLRQLADLKKENETLAMTVSALEADKETLELPVRDENYDSIKSQISEAQIEEELQQSKLKVASLEKQLEEKLKELEELKQSMVIVEERNENVEKKLESYIHENLELHNKLEKLSKSSSSAESIEIVERLTQQEHLELEKEYSKNLQVSEKSSLAAVAVGINEVTQTDMSPELNDSLLKLRDESAELMSKIELFTLERREVLEKMERLTNENKQLQEKLDALSEEKENLEKNFVVMETDKTKLESQLNDSIKEKQILSTQIQDTIANKAQLDQELTTLRQIREVMPSIDPQESASLLDSCEKSLNRLHHELESYRKVNDKNSKFNISKKLAKEAKNAHTQFTQLLNKVREASTAVETVTVFETVVAVTAANGEDLAKYEEMSQQNQLTLNDINELKQHLVKYENECLELKGLVDDLTSQLAESRLEFSSKDEAIEKLKVELEKLQKTNESLEKICESQEESNNEKIQQLLQTKKELQAKCDTYQGEMDILQSLVREQKEQLIGTFKEHEDELECKMSELEERNLQIERLQTELAHIKKCSQEISDKFNENLSKEHHDMQESLAANKVIIAEHLAELQSKQSTIESLNQQIMDLYKTMEENANKVIDKEDEIMTLQSQIDQNNEDLVVLRKENEEQKAVVDKLLIELHSHQHKPVNNQEILQLQEQIASLKQANDSLTKTKDKLETNHKDLMEKLKKYAANLKKRTAQCQEYEAKLKDLTSSNPAGSDSNLMQEEYDAQIQKLEAKVDELQTALEAKTSHHLDIMESRQALEKDLNKLQANKDEVVQEKLRIQQELNVVSQNLMQREQQVVALQETLNQTKDQMERLEQNYKQQENNILNLETIKSNLEKTLEEKMLASLDTSEFDKEKEKMAKEIEGLKEELKTKALKFDKCKAMVKERTVKNQTLQTTIKALEEKLAALEAEAAAAAASGNNKENEASSSREVLGFTKEQYDKLESEYIELSNRYKSEKANFESTIARLNALHDGIQAKLQEDMSYIERLEQENEEMRNEAAFIDNLQADMKEKVRETEHLKEQLAKYQDLEKVLQSKDLETENLKEELSKFKDLENQLNLKAKENQSLEKDLQNYRVLEEQLSAISFENENLKDELNELKEQEAILLEKSNEIIVLNEKLAGLTDLQHQLQYKSLEIQNLNEQLCNFNELQSKHDDLVRENESLKDKVSCLESVQIQLTLAFQENETLKDEVANLKNSQQLADLTSENVTLKEKILSLEAEIVFKSQEISQLTVNGEQQVQQLNEERHRLQEQLNHLTDQTSQLENELMVLRETLRTLEQAKQELEEANAQDQVELQELRHRALQEHKEVDTLRMQLDSTITCYEAEIQTLRTQILEMEPLTMEVGQNQTDDQVFIEFENKRLTDLLAEKEALIENYQRQMAQVAQPPQNPENTNFAEERSHLQQEVREKTETIQKLREEIESLKANNPAGGNAPAAAAVMNPTNANEESGPLPIFFSSDHNPAAASIFDEIIVPQRQEVNFFANPPAATPPPPPLQAQPQPEPQPSIIEDLQKNVSDLEKYAKDLENRLSLHLQREKDFDSTLQDLQMKLMSSESMLQESGSKLQALQESCDHFEREQRQAESNAQFLDQELQHYQKLLQQAEAKEQDLIKQIKQLQTKEAAPAPPEADLNMFFGVPPKPNEFDNFFAPVAASTSSSSTSMTHQPFVEEIIQPKNFYKCQDDEPPQAAGPQFFQEGPQTQANVQQTLDLLKTENERLKQALDLNSQQKDELNTKTLKLMKKLKEMKVKNDELMKAKAASSSISSSSSNNFFDGLDAAIEDELKSQIKILEIKLKEQEKAMEEQAVEKSKLLKRIDVLVSGTERMTDMKERQDMEVQMYKARIQELQAKIQHLEDWGNSDDHPANEPTTQATPEQENTSETNPNDVIDSKDLHEGLQQAQSHFKQISDEHVQEMNSKIEDLTLENETLKEQLQQMQQLQHKAEENAQLMEKLSHQTSAYETLTQSYQQIESKFNSLTLDYEQLISQNLNKKQADEALQQQVEAMKSQLELLQAANLDYQQQVGQLQQQIQALELQISQYQQMETQLTQMQQSQAIEKQTYETKIQELENELASAKAEMKSSSASPTAPANSQASTPDFTAQLQEKESEIMHLKQRIEDLMREDQTEKLVLEILTKNQDIHLLKLKVKHLEDDKLDLEQKILSIENSKLKQDNAKDFQALEQQNQDLKLKTSSLEQEMEKLLEEKANMEQELEVLNQHILKNLGEEDKTKSLILELDTKNIEIAELRRSLENSSAPQIDVVALNSNWERVVEQRCQEIAQMWQQHVAQQEQIFKQTESELRNEISLLQESLANAAAAAPPPSSVAAAEESIPSTDVKEANETSASASETSEASATIAKMQAALESQEVEIVTLKEQLAIRSAEYARLAAQYDPFKLQNTLSHSSAQDSPTAKARGETVPKPELDLAIYMLHQRDMRLEEMTLELVNLLEERDTLQLKLSNTLRKLEQVKVQTNYDDSMDEATSKSLPAIQLDESANTTSKNDELSEKLSQLQSVSHSKDKVIKEEREQRLRQMARIQQDVAKIPPAAIYEIVGSNPSEAGQSPSSILFNWLWGGNKNNENNSSNS